MARTTDIKGIPAFLKRTGKFCVWKYENQKGRKGKTKVPYDPATGRMARTNDPSTFYDFATALDAYVSGGYDGLGILTGNVGAIDIDKCFREDGSVNDVAKTVLGMLPNAYFEKSPSGKGLRGFFLLPEGFIWDKSEYYINNQKKGLEVYAPGASNRFVTVTGDKYREGDVSEDAEGLKKVMDGLMKRASRKKNPNLIDPKSYLTDAQVIEKASNSEAGDKFSDLYAGKWDERYGSQSDADMALCDILAWWCGADAEQVDRIFRTSGLMRDKWDRDTGGATYGAITIGNAIAGLESVYVPMVGRTTAEEDFGDLTADERPPYRPATWLLEKELSEYRPHADPRYGGGEIGMGALFADYFEGIARYDADRGVWMVYDGKAWNIDKGRLGVMYLAKVLATRLALYANGLGKGHEDFVATVRELQSRRKRRSMVDDASDEHPIGNAAFDSNPYYFNCANGTLNLETGEFHEHRAEDFITKASPVTYDPKAGQGRWGRFVHEIMDGKPEVARYFQKAVGYALSGDTSQECLFLMFGPTTRNGKTTAINTLLDVMGDYGRMSKPELLATAYAKVPNADGPSESVARLKGARFVGISEMERRLKLNASLVKQLTGNAVITARFLHENSFEFHFQGKIFIDTNYLPDATDPTLFDSGRVKVIPFMRHFEDWEQDKGLKAKLDEPEERSAVLNWCLEGYRLFKAEGLNPPEAVEKATQTYKEESDLVLLYASQALKSEKGKELRTSAVYRGYKEWCSENGYRYDSMKIFGKSLIKKYTIERRRPWDSKDGGDKSTFINDVTWANDEIGEDLVPE